MNRRKTGWHERNGIVLKCMILVGKPTKTEFSGDISSFLAQAFKPRNFWNILLKLLGTHLLFVGLFCPSHIFQVLFYKRYL
jgi:hypothetical protein